jgi:hypothetical protein
MLVSDLAYSFALKMEATCSSDTPVDFQRLHGVICQRSLLFIIHIHSITIRYIINLLRKPKIDQLNNISIRCHFYRVIHFKMYLNSKMAETLLDSLETLSRRLVHAFRKCRALPACSVTTLICLPYDIFREISI